MTEIHTFRCDRYSREAFINHAWGTQERSLLESRQRTLLPWAFVLFIKRTALSRPRWTTGRMGQTGQIPGWPPVSFWCHSNSLSLLSGITVSAKLANSLCVSGYRLCNRGYCLCIRNVSAISADFLWICILAGSYPCIRAALSLYLSAFPYLSKGRNSTKN